MEFGRMFDPNDLLWITAISDYISTVKRSPQRSKKDSIVYGGAHRIEIEIAEIFESQDVEWITAVSMMVDVMYQQFIRERQLAANIDNAAKTEPAVLEKVVAFSGAKMIHSQKNKSGRTF
jgi:hypothetical protein